MGAEPLLPTSLSSPEGMANLLEALRGGKVPMPPMAPQVHGSARPPRPPRARGEAEDTGNFAQKRTAVFTDVIGRSLDDERPNIFVNCDISGGAGPGS